VPLVAQSSPRLPRDWPAIIDSMSVAWQRQATIPGLSVAVGRAGRVVHHASVGVLDMETGERVSPSSVYQIASVTKQVTAALVLREVAAGRLALDDSIGSHVDGLPTSWRAATIAELLNHTSGVPSYTERADAWRARWADPMSPRALLAMTDSAPLWFAPGTQWRYDNAGYVLLGLLLERTRGVPWESLVIRDVSDALSLPSLRPCTRNANTPTAGRGRPAAADRFARGYQATTPTEALTPAPFLHLSHAHAAGALCSTTPDLVRWTFALFDGAVLPDSLRARMITPAGPARAYRYGYGVRLDSIGSIPLVYHGGDLPGFSAATLHAPSANLAIAVLANRGGVDAEQFAKDLSRVLLGVPFPEPDTAMALDAVGQALATGRYRVMLPGDETEVTLEPDGARLVLRIRGGRPLPLVYFGRRDESGRAQLRFGAEFDPALRLRLDIVQQRVVGGTLHQRGGNFLVERLP
jgi:CubicO group peptidase (beta-lactamase class C family)